MTVIFSEDFETDGNGTRYTTSIPEFSDGFGDFFTRTDLSNVGNFIDYLDREGFVFAAMDINGEGEAPRQTLSFDGIDISGLDDLTFSVDLAEDDDGTNEDWDLPDFVHFDYRIDGGDFLPLLRVESVPDGDDFNAVPAIDTDFDGDGDGTLLTSAFATFTASIAGTGSLLDLRVTFDLNSGDEDIALDNLEIAGSDASATRQVVAFDLVGSASQNLGSYTNPFDPVAGSGFTSAGDGFGIFERDLSPSIPFALLDDSLSIFTDDSVGIVKEGNTDAFFGVVDTVNSGTSGPVTAEWVFDVAGFTDLELSIDFGAMGDFEEADVFSMTYALDGVAMGDVFAFAVDEAGSQTYTLEGGSDFTLADPLLLDGTVLTDDLTSFSTALAGTGAALTVTFTAVANGGSEAVVFQNLEITGLPDAAPESRFDIAVAPEAVLEGNAGNTEIVFTVSRTVDAGAASVDIAFGGAVDADDISGGLPVGQTLDFADGETEKTVSVLIAGDAEEEADETLTATLSNAAGAILGTAEATATILDDDTVTRIHTVQGSGSASPLEGQIVTIEAVVVGDYQGGDQLRGFYLQEEDADADASTSEGVFVFSGSTPLADVAEGDLVRVTGTVEERFGQTQITDVAAIEVVDSGKGGLVSSALLDLGAGAYFDADSYEAFEGMRVELAQTMVVSEYFELERYGQLVLTENERPYQFTQLNAPDAAGLAAHEAAVAASQIILDDDNNIQNAPLANDPANDTPYPYPAPGFAVDNFFRGGDSIEGLTGVLSWTWAGFGGTDAWRLRPVETEEYVFERDNPRDAEPREVGGTLSVASFNVLNYFTTIDDGTNDARGANSTAEFERQADKIVAALLEMDADIVGLVEIENNLDEATDGDDNDTPALADLVRRLNDVAGEGTYDYVDTGVVGSDAITVAFIYQPDAVSVEGWAVLDDPDFTNPTGSERGDLNRPAVVATFTEEATGQTVTLVNNHLKSKGSAVNDTDPNKGDGQGNAPDTRSQAMVELLARLQETDPDFLGNEIALSDNVMILGDLNAYAQEDAIAVLRDAGYTDLAPRFEGEDVYSYVFDSELGTLDYALANEALNRFVTGATAWNINADEAQVLDYNDGILDPGERSFERRSTATELYAPDPFRSSDHDPILVGLQLAPNMVLEIRDRSKGTEGVDLFDNFGGTQDRMFSNLDGVTDFFVFDRSVTEDGARDRGFIFDFEIGHDVIQLSGGAELFDVREDRGDLLVRFDGDGDLLRIEGPDLTVADLMIETIVAPDMIA